MNDGRELIYFDDLDSKLATARLPDARDLVARADTAEMRYDAMFSEWVSVAATRNQRAHLPATAQCPLCVQTEKNLSEIPDNFDVVVFENKNPSFGPADFPTAQNEHGPGLTAAASGRCEVVVFSPQHEGSLAALGVNRISTVIAAWTHRTAELLQKQSVVAVFPFENRGVEIGVTLHHPHGQIYAYPFVPPTLQKIINSAQRAGKDFFQNLIASEQSSERVVLAGAHFTAFVPFAARWPLEITLMPHRSVGNLTELTDAERTEFAMMYSKILTALDEIYNSALPYISGVFQAPRDIPAEQMRLHVKITSPKRASDKLKYLAGSESAMGAWISDVTPEAAAAQIRAALA